MGIEYSRRPNRQAKRRFDNPYTRASEVTITRSDGSSEVRPAYSKESYWSIVLKEEKSKNGTRRKR